MNRFIVPLLAATAIAMTGLPLGAQEVNPADAMMKRMRETLRNTMIQLQTAQAEVATLQAKQTESETQIQELNAKVTKITKQSDADKAASEKSALEFNAKVATQSQEINLLNQSLEKWKAGYKQAAEAANATEAKRSSLADKVIGLDREVADLKSRNRELYRLGSEILLRYENFGLGRSIAAREPFTGIARVKLQTLVQDYADKLLDQKLKPGVEDSHETPPAASASPPPAPSSKPPKHKS